MAVRCSAFRVTDFIRCAVQACFVFTAVLISGFDLACKYRSCFRLGRCCRLYVLAKQLPAMVSMNIQELVHQGLYVAQVASNLSSVDMFICVANRSLIDLGSQISMERD